MKFLVITLFINIFSIVIDPCECHISIDEEERSTKFILSKNSKIKKCDTQMGNRWFRFISGAGGLIPTTPPQQNACGKIFILNKKKII